MVPIFGSCKGQTPKIAPQTVRGTVPTKIQCLTLDWLEKKGKVMYKTYSDTKGRKRTIKKEKENGR